jgi:hypothetical protein
MMQLVLIALLYLQPTYSADTTVKTVRTQSIEKTADGNYEVYFYNAADIPPYNTAMMIGKSGKKLVSFQVIGKPTELYTVKCRVIKAYQKESEWLGSQSLFSAYRAAVAPNPTLNEEAALKKKPLKKVSRTRIEGSNTRTSAPLGIDICYGSAQPFGTFFGARLNYHITDWLKVGAGYGATPFGVVNISSIGGGIALYYPDWRLSPFLGVDYHIVNGGVPEAFASIFSAGATSLNVLSFPFGVDWQTEGGFHFAVLFAAASGTNGFGISTFSAQAGWYFGGSGASKSSSMDSVF